MIRKFNYTGRKKIRRTRVRVDLFRDGEGRRLFNIALQLDGMALPAEASIHVEAYHRTAYQRFDCGTIADKHIPEDRFLHHLPDSVTPLFRVKVVDRERDHGRILASLDKIRPETIDQQPVGSQCLLYVEYADLGQRIWELDLDGDWPSLRLNRQAGEISLIASGDDRFMALVYPEVLRQILTRIVIGDEHADPDCDDDWPSLWLQLACSLAGQPVPPIGAADDQKAWIDAAVEGFCHRNLVLERFAKAFQGGK